MKKQFFSKIVAVMLAVVMVVAMVPLTVVAAHADEPIAAQAQVAPAAVETDSLVSTLGGSYTYPLFNSGKTGAGQNQSGGNETADQDEEKILFQLGK